MAEKYWIDAISKRFQSMSGRKRTGKIRKLASESSANKKFIEKMFLNLYQETFPSSVSSAHP